MIKRTLEVSAAAAHLTVRHQQLVLERDRQPVGQFPCEDLGVVLVEHPGCTYSHAALTALLEAGAVLVVCGRDHLPLGLLLPLADHSTVVWRLRDQLKLRRPLRKQLWQQLVRAKIRAQAENLAAGTPPHRKLLALVHAVRSGDPDNIEARAARVYWQSWLGATDVGPATLDNFFRRDPDGHPPNALLNYGYAVLRAAVARALVAAGLLPVLGLQHAHRANAFCLADDLLEPLRPLVDARVRELYLAGQMELDQPTKASLLELLTLPVEVDGEQGPLLVAVQRMVNSLVQCYAGQSRRLEIPSACKSVDTDRCGS